MTGPLALMRTARQMHYTVWHRMREHHLPNLHLGDVDGTE
jgi:hypothetical protein